MVIDIYDPEQVFNNSGDGILANAGKKLLAEKSELEDQLRSERRRFHQAIIKFANINGDLEDRIVTLEEMLRLSEGLRKQEGGRNEG